MSQEFSRNDLRGQTQQLLDGPLKHIKAAVLAAALLPLAASWALKLTVLPN